MSRARQIKKFGKQIEGVILNSDKFRHVTPKQQRRAETAIRRRYPWIARVEDSLRDILPRLRKYASYRAWLNRQKHIPELDVAKEVAKHLARDPGLAIRDLRPAPEDPPDVLGTDSAGRTVAIEVVELVDSNAVEANQNQQIDPRVGLPVPVYRMWTMPEVLARIEELVRKKDRKKYLGGPFHRIVVAVHTDEPDINRDECVEALRGLVIRNLVQVDEVYLVFSPDSTAQSAPVVGISSERR